MRTKAIIIIMVLSSLFVTSCNGQDKTRHNYANTKILTEKEKYPMTYQFITLTKEEQSKIEKIIKKDGETRKIKVSEYASQIHCFLFISYEVKKDFIVLDSDPNMYHFSVIFNTKTNEILRNSRETLAHIAQTIDIFNNQEISDEDIIRLISKVLFGGKLLTDKFQFFGTAEPPVLQRNEKFIKCTAYLKVSDSGMTKPRAVKYTISIDNNFNVECNKHE